jgi:amino acid transporter
VVFFLFLAVLNKYVLHRAAFFVVVVVLFLFMCWKLLITSTDESKEASRSYRGPAFRKVSRLWPIRVCFIYFLGSVIICRLYKLTLLYQAQVTPQLRVSLYDYV